MGIYYDMQKQSFAEYLHLNISDEVIKIGSTVEVDCSRKWST